ncbi:MAG: hypothetical protein AB1347_10165 [Acidobacteriota bacterium]
MRKTHLLPVACMALAVLTAPRAQTGPDEFERKLAALEGRMAELTAQYEAQIEALKKEVAALREAATSGRQAPGLPAAPAAPPAANLLNPSLSVIPDFTFSAGNDSRWTASDAAALRELELSFSASIDPYARAFASLALHKHGHSEALADRFGGERGHEEEEHAASEGYTVDVEEAYAVFPGLPGGLTLKAGRFYAGFGKENAHHLHTWPQADRPLALNAVLGGEGHGLSDVGLGLTKILPTPWLSDITAEVLGGRSEDLFGGRRSDLAYLLAWRHFWDLSEESSVEALLSGLGGKNETGGATRLGNLSLTYRWRPLSNRHRALLWRTEYLRRDDGVHGPAADHAVSASPLRWTERTEGLFSYVDWQVARGWSLGARADWVKYPGLGRRDQGGALVLTWYPSEYQKLRVQIQRVDYAVLGPKNALVVEYGFSLGPHGAHPF